MLVSSGFVSGGDNRQMMVLRPPRDLSMVVRLNRNNGVCYHSIPALRIKNPTDHYRLNLTIAIPFKSNGSLPHVCVSLGDLCIDVSFNSLPCPPCWRSAKDEANRRHRRFIVLISTDGGYSLIFFCQFFGPLCLHFGFLFKRS